MGNTLLPPPLPQSSIPLECSVFSWQVKLEALLSIYALIKSLLLFSWEASVPDAEKKGLSSQWLSKPSFCWKFWVLPPKIANAHWLNCWVAGSNFFIATKMAGLFLTLLCSLWRFPESPLSLRGWQQMTTSWWDRCPLPLHILLKALPIVAADQWLWAYSSNIICDCQTKVRSHAKSGKDTTDSCFSWYVWPIWSSNHHHGRAAFLSGE